MPEKIGEKSSKNFATVKNKASRRLLGARLPRLLSHYTMDRTTGQLDALRIEKNRSMESIRHWEINWRQRHSSVEQISGLTFFER